MFNSTRGSARKASSTAQHPRDQLLEQIRDLVYRRYAGDISRVFIAFNADRDGNVDFEELLDGLQRVFWLQPDRQLLWEALDLDRTQGKMSLQNFTRHFGTKVSDLSNSQKWSTTHTNTATPEQNLDTAAYRHLKAAQARNPTRQPDISTHDLNAMAGTDIIATILHTLESTEIRAKQLFQELDAGQDRRLNATELQNALQVLGLPVSFEQTASVIQIFDRDGDRELKYSEFLRLLSFVQQQRDIEKVDIRDIQHNASNRYGDDYSSKYEDFTEAEVSYKPTTVQDAARCSKARKQREEVSSTLGVDTISALDYKRLEMISNGVYASRRKVRMIFKLMDMDGDKRVNAEELVAGLDECRVRVSVAEAEALVDHFSEGSGSLTFSNFMRLLAASRG